VLHGTASFDEVPPSVEFWREKIGAILAKGWPFLVATEDGQVIGYCYATQFRDRPAYAFTCENSIYVHPDRVGQGIGRAMLAELVAAAKTAKFREMIAVIGGAEPASVAVHRACGFVETGRMKSVGYKFGRWLDSLYMQLRLHDD
jgi:phosphinothricin acetyltransferase